MKFLIAIVLYRIERKLTPLLKTNLSVPRLSVCYVVGSIHNGWSGNVGKLLFLAFPQFIGCRAHRVASLLFSRGPRTSMLILEFCLKVEFRLKVELKDNPKLSPPLP